MFSSQLALSPRPRRSCDSCSLCGKPRLTSCRRGWPPSRVKEVQKIMAAVDNDVLRSTPRSGRPKRRLRCRQDFCPDRASYRPPPFLVPPKFLLLQLLPLVPQCLRLNGHTSIYNSCRASIWCSLLPPRRRWLAPSFPVLPSLAVLGLGCAHLQRRAQQRTSVLYIYLSSCLLSLVAQRTSLPEFCQGAGGLSNRCPPRSIPRVLYVIFVCATSLLSCLLSCFSSPSIGARLGFGSVGLVLPCGLPHVPFLFPPLSGLPLFQDVCHVAPSVLLPAVTGCVVHPRLRGAARP